MNFPKMFRIYLFLNLLNVAFSAQFTNYYVENLFNDVLCVSSASKLTGVFPLLSTCATRCARTFDCMSFFFNNVNQECFSVNGVLTSRDGCEAMPGTSYYLRQADIDCYTYTQAEQNQMISSSGMEQCESYPFHMFTGGQNQDVKGCGTCNCCQVKGCYTGSPRQYNGTWSQTKYGRLCQRWDSQSPHGHTRNNPSDFPDESLYDAHNYCRDPDYEGAPWCYTVDASRRYEFCDIPKC